MTLPAPESHDDNESRLDSPSPTVPETDPAHEAPDHETQTFERETVAAVGTADVDTPADLFAETATEDLDEGTSSPADTAESPLGETLASIEASLTAFHERARALERTNENLYALTQKLQEDSVFDMLRPLFERLSALHANALDCASFTKDPSAHDDFHDLAEQVLSIFQLFDIESVEAEVGGTFESRLHNAFQKKTTDDESKDGTIARVRRQGFIRSGRERVYLPAQVAVYRYSAPAAEPAGDPQ